MTIEGITSTEFRAACSTFPTGVTLVTRTMPDGRPYGMTVSSFTSVSLEPPLILVCIDRRAGFLANLSADAAFAVNVLGEDQQALAVRFSRPPEGNRFESAAWTQTEENVPIIHGAVAVFVCSLHKNVAAGDHHVLIGCVRRIHRNGGQPLVWCGSDYHCLPRPVPRDV